MAGPDVVWKNGRFGQTSRRDTWWLSPSAGSSSGWVRFWCTPTGPPSERPLHLRALHLTVLFAGDLRRFAARLFGPKPAWYPSFLPFSPALLILWIPGLFRFTCYYYRGAYYKSFWADPPACAVSEPRKSYLGERSFPLILQNLHRYFLRLSYLGLGFSGLRRREGLLVSRRLRNRHRNPRAGRECRPAGRLCLRLPCLPAPDRWNPRSNLGASGPAQALRLRELSESATTRSGRGRVCSRWALPISMSASAPWASGMTGESCRCRNIRAFSYDVLVIGAGGAGLRAAIEAAASGVKVGVVCKSLLGKAHTVMAEGGIAAALANVDDRDNWRVHFADTMRGGQYLNNWRMAELHAKEAPERVRELEAWGALFDRTKDGRILQRNFGGHRYPRLAHVGDRTGLEMIRTLQDHGIHTGMEVHMECTVLSLLMDSGRVAGAFGYDREKGHFILWPAKAVVMATGGIGRAFKITSNSWEYTGDGLALAYRAGAELQDMEFVQFHPTGMVWPISVRGILVTEGVRGEGGVLRNSEGRRFMFDDIPDLYKAQTADNEEEGWRYTQGDKNARRPPELLTRDHVARCINREVKAGRGTPARRRLSRHRLDQGTASEMPRSISSASCPACTTSSSSSPISISRRSRWKSAPPRTT